MEEVAIVSCARSAIGKVFEGAYGVTRGTTPGAHVIRHALDRARLRTGDIHDVLLGCAFPEGANGFNLGRMSALAAGLPDSVPGVTINRYCFFRPAIDRFGRAGDPDRPDRSRIEGGRESVSCVQNHLNLHMKEESSLAALRPQVYMPMLETAEVMARPS